ncbi:MAG: type II toxin-antitoxin system ParD family antitoxin [Myxococcota bacterium]
MAKHQQESELVPYNTPVPEKLHRSVQERMAAGGFNSKAEYVRSLMRADVERAAQARLEAKLARAMLRGNMKEATPEFWERLRSEVLSDG